MPYSQELVWLQLFWPRPLSTQTVSELLQRLVADPHSGRLVFETRAHAKGIVFLLGVRSSQRDTIAHIVRELVPGMQYTDSTKQPAGPGEATSRANLRPRMDKAARITTNRSERLLAVSQIEAATRRLLAACSELSPGECVTVQVQLGRRRPPRRVPYQSWWDVLMNGYRPPTNTRLDKTDRCQYHCAQVNVRIGVAGMSHARARQQLLNIFGAMRSVETSHARLRLTPESATRLNQASVPWYPFYTTSLLAASEIALLTGWPIGDSELPVLGPISPRVMPPPHWLSGTQSHLAGRVFGVSNVPGHMHTSLGISPADSLLHTVLLGPTGVGKSTAMLRLILADIRAGRGVLVIDPKSDLVTSLLERIPPSRHKDVVLLDPTMPQVVGLNPLVSQAARQHPDLVADSLLASFKSIFAESWGVRTEEVLAACLLTLARVSQSLPDVATLVAIPSLLTNPELRRRITSKIDDPLGVSSFWAKFDSWSPEQQRQVIAPVLNKLQQLVVRPHMRAVLGQTAPHFQLDELFTKRNVVLIRLNKGTLGAEAARLLGSLVMGQLWPLILGRANDPPTRRAITSIYIDEVHDFIQGIPGDLADALAQSRSLGVGFTMAHQYRSQLSLAMQRAIDANARNKICFELSGADAKDMAAMAASHLVPADFMLLSRFRIYASYWCKGAKTGWLSGTTLPPPGICSDPLAIAAASCARYGQPAEQVEAELRHALGWETPTVHQTTPRNKGISGASSVETHFGRTTKSP